MPRYALLLTFAALPAACRTAETTDASSGYVGIDRATIRVKGME